MQMSRFINIELKSDSDSALESEKIESKVDNELMAKLESDSDNDSEWNIIASELK